MVEFSTYEPSSSHKCSCDDKKIMCRVGVVSGLRMRMEGKEYERAIEN